MITARTGQSAMTEALYQEWLLLQQQVEQQERQALQIKLLAVVLVAVGRFAEAPLVAAILVLLLWLQEAIGRTQQARLFEYLLHIEAAIRSDSESVPMQLNSRWQVARGGTVQLLKEYLRNSLRPTVALPYLPLVLLSALMWWHAAA